MSKYLSCSLDNAASEIDDILQQLKENYKMNATTMLIVLQKGLTHLQEQKSSEYCTMILQLEQAVNQLSQKTPSKAKEEPIIEPTFHQVDIEPNKT